ncbi:MAG TPA: hypothetical protein VLV17_05590 [Anaeromyxobacteraceae bacterium]|nr:hypothetical protein [Anaeromyxobacteraceae bacterium]
MAQFTDRELAAIGREAAQNAWQGGLGVLRPDGSVVEIPLVAEPAVFSRSVLAALASEAKAILSAAVKLARALLEHGDERDREALLGPFEGLEAEAMAQLFHEAPCPAVVARVDFLGPPLSPSRALELNATIPAMPGYADLAAHAWVRAAARARGLPPRRGEDLVAACGSNMESLRETLVAFYRSRGGSRGRPSIAVVSRPGDAQTGELGRLVAHFRQMGHEAQHLVPTGCIPEEWDILYRHVWAHRTPPDSPFARALRSPRRFVLANPVNGMLEAKALFARLSECAADERLSTLASLDAAEREAAARLPFTRRLDERLAPLLIAEPERWVIKRSWDYGGKSVHLGGELDRDEWARAVDSALKDRRGGGFVAQERVTASRQPATRVSPSDTSSGLLYRDVSTYAGLGEKAPSGSVVRAATSPVVNILGGGGLAPLVPEDVLLALG